MDNSFVKKHLADCMKDAKTHRQKDKRAMYLDGNGGWGCVSSSYIRLLVKMFLVEVPIQVPIRELRTREIEDRQVAAVMFLDITDKACPRSLLSICRWLEYFFLPLFSQFQLKI